MKYLLIKTYITSQKTRGKAFRLSVFMIVFGRIRVIDILIDILCYLDRGLSFSFNKKTTWKNSEEDTNVEPVDAVSWSYEVRNGAKLLLSLAVAAQSVDSFASSLISMRNIYFAQLGLCDSEVDTTERNEQGLCSRSRDVDQDQDLVADHDFDDESTQKRVLKFHYKGVMLPKFFSKQVKSGE
uniref:Uncharacterized protein n=1 Tax=Strigamia maritima TaxID=126957 RepID=T1IR40_STRMM